MKAAELREKSLEELRNLETELADSVFKNKIKKATSELKNTAGTKFLRKELARIKTIIKEKQVKG